MRFHIARTNQAFSTKWDECSERIPPRLHHPVAALGIRKRIANAELQGLITERKQDLVAADRYNYTIAESNIC